MNKRIGLVLAVVLILGAIAGPIIGQDTVAPIPAAAPYTLDNEELGLSEVFKSVVNSTVNIAVAGNNAPLGTGSGFVIDNQGYIVTNNHVVEDADYIQVTFYNGVIVEAQLIGRDPDADIAVIQVDPNTPGLTLQPVEFADSNQVVVGQRVMAIGSPFGENFTLTTGIISAVDRNIQGSGRFSIPEVIQTDAAINPGNSGGPLLNWAGQVIGMNTAILSTSRSGSGVGFAVPANIIRRIAPYLIEFGEYQHSYLGMGGTTLTPPVREAMNVPFDVNGVLVARIEPGGPVEKAGLRGATGTIQTPFGELPINGDIITAINGVPITQFNDLIAYLAENTQPGDTVTLTIWRDGQPRDVPVILQARPRPEQPPL